MLTHPLFYLVAQVIMSFALASLSHNLRNKFKNDCKKKLITVKTLTPKPRTSFYKVPT